tara:strand:+ start:1035 stop:2831 length:1797 start_codon:yes stop_codon:yes gene_type:complete
MGVLLAILVGVYAFYLGIKLTRLENEVNHLRSGQVQETGVPVVPPTQPETQQLSSAFIDAAAPEAADLYASRAQAQGVPPPAAPQQPMVYEPTGADRFLAWLKEDFFVKLGAFLLIIAFGWFVNYAFANNWIGPMGRIVLGLVAGVLFMTLGVWRIPIQKHQGAIFTVLGSTVVLITVFAAREVYDFFTPATALGLMFASVVFVAFVSVRYHRPELAFAGLVLAGIAPFLTNPPEPNTLTLLSYLMLVVLGTLWVVRLTGSNVLTFSALLLAFFYSLPLWGMGGREDELIGLLFAFAFTAVFFVSNIVGILQRPAPEARQGQIITAVFTAVYLMSWIMVAASPQWQSLLYIAWMLVFSSGAFVVYVHTNYRVPFYIYSAVGVLLMGAATAVELDGALLTIAYTLEAATIVLLAAVLLRDVQVAQRLSLLFAVPVVLSLEHITSYAWRDSITHEHFFALVILTVTLMVSGLVLLGAKKAGEATPVAAQVLSIGGVAYLLILVWLMTHAIMPDDSATFVSLVIYTILGLAFFIRGKLEDDMPLATLGGVLLGLVVARLLLIDVWQMELFGRVITFGAVGVLLISTAFIGKGKQQTDVIQE